MSWSRRVLPAERSADNAAARDKALELLTGRDFACQELYERLCRRFTDEAAASAVASMVQLHYLDDARYAMLKARSLMAQNKSRRAVADVLRRKGVEKQIIADTLETLYTAVEDVPDPEVGAAAALIQKMYTRKLADGRQDLVLAALARRGFGYAAAKAALRIAAAEKDENHF